jgi:hypothetical protein
VRWLLALLALIALPAYAQVVGWAKCEHTQLDEKLLSVQIALMNGKVERWESAVIAEPQSKAPGLVIEFEAKTLNYTITGFRLKCSFAVPGLEGTDHEATVRWLPINHVKIPAGTAPKFAVNIVETSPGLWRAKIGKVPSGN